MVISETCCNFKVLIYIELQTKIAMITEDKITEIFCMADDFCKFFDAMITPIRFKVTSFFTQLIVHNDISILACVLIPSRGIYPIGGQFPRGRGADR
ncbi:hypothetical protein FHS60_000440 [Alloprevotella rava]|uniref:Uncharacterized protein n=1 Tax=Alloprevotella rava TaxID=671218 RepID=A0A7W5ULP0_9BACT|nr:hypothetical protein [Alloprevotella rava]